MTKSHIRSFGATFIFSIFILVSTVQLRVFRETMKVVLFSEKKSWLKDDAASLSRTSGMKSENHGFSLYY